MLHDRNHLATPSCTRSSCDERSPRPDVVRSDQSARLKPHMAEFEPQGDVFQPAWSHEIMTDYFADSAGRHADV